MQKLLKFLSQLEEHTNKSLIKIFEKIALLVSKLTPLSVKKFNKRVKLAVTVKIGNIKFTIANIVKKTRNFIDKHKNDFFSFLKNKTFELVNDIKKTFIQTNFEQLKAKFKRKVIYPIKKRLSAFFGIIKRHLIITISICVVVISLSLTLYIKINNYYKEIDRIEDEKSFALKSARHDYFHGNQRTSDIIRLMLPIYVETAIGTKSLYLDIILEASNRLIILFIKKFEYMIIDHLIVTISPLMSTWPLKEEGKKIILGKIQDEINAFLKEKNIRGEIKRVYIDWLMEG
ncbi:MAG: hypothetical protein HQK49_14590 [Oligoflexia bacterium]|nr:hypothetical protein [Oligoflexia bacterium]